jgi:hypothetical protein
MLSSPVSRSSKSPVIAALIVTTLVALACSEPDEPSSPAASAPRPSATPTEVAALRMPNRVCCLGQAIDPGMYASPTWFEAPISFDVGSGWRGLSAAQEEIFALVQGENAIGHAERWLGFFVAPSAERLVRQLRATPSLQINDVSAVEFGASDGTQLDGVAEPNPDQKRESSIERGTIALPAVAALVPGFWYTESPGAKLRFIVLGADGGVLLAYIEAPPGAFDRFSRKAVSVLETLRFGPP